MSEGDIQPTTFELVEGATFTLSDGSAVTVRDDELELSDGRRLPMPAAGETITVERTEKRPDGGTVRIKHTIRLSETPAPSGAGVASEKSGLEGKDGTNAGTENGGKEEDIPTIDADEIQALPETPPVEPEKSTTEDRPLIMGLHNRSKGSLRAMLWGSIPEGDDVTTYSPNIEVEDAPKSGTRSLLHPHHSIKEESESEHEREETPEAFDASENANESFEFEGKVPKSDNTKDSLKDVAAVVAKATDTAGKVTVLAFDIPQRSVGSMPKENQGTETTPNEENLISNSSDHPPSADKSSSDNDKPTLARQGHVPSATELLKGVPGFVIASVSVPTQDEPPVKGKHDEEYPSDESRGQEPASNSAGKESNAPSEHPNHSETSHELHLKLTPILKSLEFNSPVSSVTAFQEEPPVVPVEDRKGTVPPNTPAVTEDRDSEPSEGPQDPDTVSVPKVVSYYESITPSKQPWSNEDAPPRVRKPEEDDPVQPRVESKPTQTSDPDTYIVPKIVNFAVPLQPQKVYLGTQEPEEMENTPIPTPQHTPSKPQQKEPVAERVSKPELVHHIQTVRMVPVQTAPDSEPSPHPPPAAHNPEPQQAQENKPKPREYDPTLFEHEPKRPLLLTSEATESAPPYEAGVHDSRTLPIGCKDLPLVVTEQPPPFQDHEEHSADPRDPFLPDNPRPGMGHKQNGWIGTCFELCCCCWAP